MSLWLTEDELRVLTGFAHRKRQIEVLAKLTPPIKFRVREHDSFPLVDRAQFEGITDGTPARTKPASAQVRRTEQRHVLLPPNARRVATDDAR